MSIRGFWNPDRSTALTIAVTWIGLAGAVVMIPALVPVLELTATSGISYDGTPETPYGDDFVFAAAVPLYVCLFVGIGAMILLLRLLGDIRRGEVFTATNVSRLRLISYCGFAIFAACLAGVIVSELRLIFVFLALVAGFLGLVMRVIKNVIDSARLLKEDADYTI